MNYFRCIRVPMVVLLTGAFFSACKQSDLPEPESAAFVWTIPANFPEPQPDVYNPLTHEGVKLGQRLFYDTRLSGNNRVSCASCHRQDLAFSDGVALSTAGVAGTQLRRHSPTLINMAWAGNGLFWDGGSTNLESQAFGPLSAHDEMGQNLFELIRELKADSQYPAQFRAAFDGEITAANVVRALAQFQRTLVSANSRYDHFVRGERGGTLNATELKGMQLVKEKCQGCHATDLFTDNKYHNNGLDADFSNTEHEEIYRGRYRVSYDLKDLGAYKTPTLRNVAITAPYMHDGRLATLEEVLDHYAGGVKASPSLSGNLMVAGVPGIPLAADEKKQIIAFLKTLTDEVFIRDPKWANPETH